MREIIEPSYISFGVPCRAKREALRRFSEEDERLGITTSAEATLCAYELREEEGTTGLLNGFAIPHAKSAEISHAAVLVHRYAAPITDWESLDGSPVEIAISLLIPENEAGTTHLQLLSKLAVCLMREDFREVMRTIAQPDELCAYIKEQLAA